MQAKSFGILKQTSHEDELDKYIEELTINGSAVIENVLNEEELAILRHKLDQIYTMQVNEFSEQKLASINESYMVRLPLAYDDYFINLVKKEKIIKVLQQVIGNYFILHLQNGIINMPKQEHHQNSWHRDLPYQDFVISKPLAIGALYCIDDFNESTGGTLIVPFSHKLEKMPSAEYVKKYATQITAPKGSVILFDSMVFHRAGYNSSDQIRRGINHMFTAPIIQQQISIPESLNGKFKDDPFLKRLLGYDIVLPKNVFEWRDKRIKK